MWEPSIPITPSQEESETDILVLKPDKKLAAERQALALVASLVEEPVVTEDQMRELIRRVEPRHYADLEEERFIAGNCAYPLCGNPRPDNKNQGKYRINLHQKKVFDITKRKMYCSNFCFTASRHLSEQVPLDACWDRPPGYSFRPPNFLKRGEEIVKTEMKASFTDRDGENLSHLEVQFSSMSLRKEKDHSAEVASSTGNLDSDDDPDPPDFTRDPKEDEDESDCETSSTSSADSLDYMSKNQKSPSLFNKVILLPLSSLATNPVATKPDTVYRKIKLSLADWVSVCNYMMQWKTTETMNLFRYRNYEAACENGQAQAEPLSEDQTEEQQKPQNPSELVVESIRKLVQLPGRNVCAEQREYELRVMAFFAGEQGTRVRFADENTSEKEDNSSAPPVEVEQEVILPAVDSVDQMRIREHLAMEKLSSSCVRSFKALVQNQPQSINNQLSAILDFVAFVNNNAEITAMFRKLVSTFKLTSENTALVPTEWTLASLLLFAACCQSGSFEFASSKLIFESETELFFYDCCKNLFTWFPNARDVQVFIEKFTRVL